MGQRPKRVLMWGYRQAVIVEKRTVSEAEQAWLCTAPQASLQFMLGEGAVSRGLC